METKSFFGENGLTSTSANHYANLAKEMTRKIKERLDSVRFFDTKMRIIGDDKQSVIGRGTASYAFDYIRNGLDLISKCNSLIAFFREAISEKERLMQKASAWEDTEKRADLDARIAAHQRLKPVRGAYLSTEDVIKSWTVGEQEKYLSLEAEASVYGKFIHEDGRLSKARTDLMKVIDNPILVKESGRDTIIYDYTPSVTQDEVDGLFFELQAHYREVQAELNGMKKRIDDTIREHALKVDDEFRKALAKWSVETKALSSELEVIIADENLLLKQMNQDVQALKIVVPNRLQKVFKDLQELG